MPVCDQSSTLFDRKILPTDLPSKEEIIDMKIGRYKRQRKYRRELPVPFLRTNSSPRVTGPNTTLRHYYTPIIARERQTVAHDILHQRQYNWFRHNTPAATLSHHVKLKEDKSGITQRLIYYTEL